MRKFQHGFTLIELLAAISVIGVVGTIMLGVIFSSIRGAGKSEAQISVSQNGTVALSQISRVIRNAAGVSSTVVCSPDSTDTVATSSVSFRTIDGDTVDLSCDNDTISSNGASLVDPTSVTVSSCSFICIQSSSFSPPVITTSFALNKKSAGGFVETNSLQQFQNTVSIRNIR